MRVLITGQRLRRVEVHRRTQRFRPWLQSAHQTVRDRLLAIATEEGLRQSTVPSYERLFGTLGILDEVEVSQEDGLSRLWTIDNPNTRRAAVIALRSAFGWRIKVPRGVPRRYDLPDEDTMRPTLMTRAFVLCILWRVRLTDCPVYSQRNDREPRLRRSVDEAQGSDVRHEAVDEGHER